MSDDLHATRHVSGEVLGCLQARSADSSIDWDLNGHQLVTYLAPAPPACATSPASRRQFSPG